MRSALLGKVAFWLIVIGVVALITPNPAWPEWFARMVLSSGIALGVTLIVVGVWERRRTRKGERKPSEE